MSVNIRENGKYQVRVMIKGKVYCKTFGNMNEAKIYEHSLEQKRKIENETGDDYYNVMRELTFQYNTKFKKKISNELLSKKESLKVLKLMPNSVEGELKRIDQMDGINFEKYCISLLKLCGKLNNCIFESTIKSNDYGADIVLDCPNGTRVVIQCKRSQQTIGIDAIQEVYAAKKHYGATTAAVITNNYFSESAIRLSNDTNVHIIDRTLLSKLILIEIDFVHHIMYDNQWEELMEILRQKSN